MAEYLSPGVYVEEFDSGAVPMEGVSTSTAGFIGLAQRGDKAGLPVLITGMHDFFRNFGGYLSEKAFGDYRYLAYAVEHFFLNGGSRCYVMRVVPENAKSASNAGTKEADKLLITAKNEGAWGDQIRVEVGPASKAKSPVTAVVGEGANKYKLKGAAGFNVGDTVAYFDGGMRLGYFRITGKQDDVIELNDALPEDPTDTGLVPTKWLATCEFDLIVIYGGEVEQYEKVSLNDLAPNHIGKVTDTSNIALFQDLTEAGADEEIIAPFTQLTGLEEEGYENKNVALSPLSGGSDGSIESETVADGLYIGSEEGGPGARTGIQAFKDNDEVSIMAIPGVTSANVQLNLTAHCENMMNRFAILDMPIKAKKTDELQKHRNYFDTSYGAVYHPWLQVFDPLDKRNTYIPPSGSVAGIYSRSDTKRGVHKAPANEVVQGCTGLSVQYNKGEQDVLNPKGINLIRAFTGQGIRVWGARTMSSNGLWKYVNVRRLFIFVEESIRRGTNWVVFEPNDGPLWARVQRTIDAFLTRVWRDGALQGSSTGEAFYVNIGRNTMTQDDIDNGRLICVIGIAPVKPAEFVIFRITQKTSEE